MTFTRAELAAAAEVDPWALLGQLRAGDPNEIEELAAAFYRAGGDASDAHRADARATELARQGYRVNGAAPVDANAEARQTSGSLSDAAEKLPKIAKVLASVAEDLADTTGEAAKQVSGLDRDLARLDQQWHNFLHDGEHHGTQDEITAVKAQLRQQAVDAVRSYGTTVNTAVMSYEHTLASATKSMAELGYVVPPDLREAGEQPTPALPLGSDPVAVASWWASLTPAQQEWLIDHDYDTLGQLRGLPAPVLDTSNRHRLDDDITRLRKQLQDPNLDAGQRNALQGKLDQDEGILGALDRPGPGQPPAPTLLLAYSPDGSHGQTGAEISVGNPDTAADTAVVVPGTGSNATNIGGLRRNADNLFNRMGSPSKAVVVWLDGAEPQSLTAASDDSWAEDDTNALVGDLNGLRAAHQSASGDGGHLTGIGHSYGSYILGRALTHGAHVDDTVFIGSPGVGVNHAGDLGLDPQHVWDGQAGDDPILIAQHRFTPDPLSGNNPSSSAFGGQHFSVDGSHGHSQYYQGESLTNMARIASGDYNAVDRTPAPDYRGPMELPGDALAYTLDPIDGTYHTIDDAIHGHPLDALKDGWGTVTNIGKDGVNLGKDGVQVAEDVGKEVNKVMPWNW